VRTDAFTMEYFRFGRGERTCVILPGVSVRSVMGAADAVAAAYDVLAEDFTVYVFDRRTELPPVYTVRDMARDTAEAFRALGLHDVCLFGASQGGMIALVMAIEHPELVRKLALGSTTARMRPAENDIFDRWIRLAKDGDRVGLMLEFGRVIYPPEVFRKAEATLISEGERATDAELERFITLLEGTKDFSVVDELNKIRCPVLVIGAFEDAVLDSDATMEIAEKLDSVPGFRLYLYTGYGHAAFDTAPDYRERLCRFFLSGGAGRVVILATGGTIAGVGKTGKTAGYQPGALTAAELIRDVPALESVAPVEAIQVCNVNSDDITDTIWLSLAETINRMAKDPDVAGFVVTHGTDTLEETAYFLNLTVKTDKPVVLTGSMRPATAMSADGPMNLYEAVCTAASKEARGKGVLAVFSDRIYTARSVTKTSTYHVSAIAAGELGAIGVVRDGSVYLYETPGKRHTAASEFDVSGLHELPKVSILYFAVDADPALLTYAAAHADGVVIAGAGAGEYSRKYKTAIESLSVPVVVSSRIDDGIILPENLLCSRTIAADNLSPQKAAILLRLALTKTTDRAEIQKMFSAY